MNEKDIKLQKVKKSVSTTAKVVKVFSIIARVVACIVLVATVLVFAFHSQIDTEIANRIKTGDGSISIKDISIGGLVEISAALQELADNGYYAYAIGGTMIYAIVMCVIMAIFFSVFGKIFKLMLEGETPFNAAIMSKLKKSFIALVVITAIFTDLGYALILALVLWSVYTILDYGCALQKQSDETL